MHEYSETQIQALRARFEVRTERKETGCIEWTAYKDKDYYGHFVLTHTKKVLAHRYSYRLYKGNFSPDLFVLHTCDNPACVNPAHLFLGTHKDNSADKVTKNRQARGSSAGNVKLNEQAVTEILASAIPDYSLAAQYGVSPATVHSIRLRIRSSLPTRKGCRGRRSCPYRQGP